MPREYPTLLDQRTVHLAAGVASLVSVYVPHSAVDVQVGEVALPQRDQMPLGAEVVLQPCGPAVAGDGEFGLGLLAGPRGTLV
jgi:hypothetical protein